MAQSDRKPFLIRIWNGFWNFIDGTRRIVFNIIFILLLVLILKVIFSDGQKLIIKQDTALVIRPNGIVVEQYSGDPLDRALSEATGQERPETRIRDLVDAIDLAVDDEKIARIVLVPDYLWSMGLANLQEMGKAIDRFKASGKPVIAIAENLSQHQYYFAALADEIWLNPDGLVWIDGYSRYRNFYKDALDKLAVEINLFRVGEYKSAMEPFVRNDMSDQAEEANLFWLNSLWQQYLQDISRNRGLPVPVIASLIEDYARQLESAGGDFAGLALEMGLVDKLVARPDARNTLINMGAATDSGKSFRQIGFRNYLEFNRSPILPGKEQIAVVVAEGNIIMGEESPGVVAADSAADLIREAAARDNVKALVLRVNSPGGNAFASEVVRRELQAVRDAGKPVVISMGNVAASGGYWISLAADEIWTNPATITGSIGIFGMIPTFPQTLAKLGIYNDGVGTTSLAGSIRPERSLTEDAKTIFQSATEHGYQEFLEKVAAARQMDKDQVHQVARGRIWSGSQAIERGLVDQSGSLAEAVASAARRAGLGENYRVEYIEPHLSTLERLLVNMTSQISSQLDIQLENPLQEWLSGSLIQNLLGDLSLISRGERDFALYAHCLCGVD